MVSEANTTRRGTLGVDKAAPVGFPRVRLRFEIDSDATDEQLARLLSLTERHCVVAQTLKNPPEFASEIVPNRPADG
jgi:uncharacterized OsmC-like protein